MPEALFGASPGIVRTKVGYAGGTKENPSYYKLGDHTETVEVHYDPNETDYSKLLHLFWEHHDSTRSCSRQYMSAIFYLDDSQKELAEKSFEDEQKRKSKPIKTKILPADKFYTAEDYHQKFMLQRHPSLCNALDIEPGEDLVRSHVAARINGYVAGCGTVPAFEKEWPSWGIDEKTAEYIKKQLIRNACR